MAYIIFWTDELYLQKSYVIIFKICDSVMMKNSRYDEITILIKINNTNSIHEDNNNRNNNNNNNRNANSNDDDNNDVANNNIDGNNNNSFDNNK